MEKLTRRKLLKGSVKAAPLLALASSKSVWASGGCPSAAASNNFSGVTHVCKGSKGLTPGFFKNHVQCWPVAIFAGLFLFKNKSFGIEWDWTMGTHGFSTNAEKLYGWSKGITVNTGRESYGSYASTWRGLLGAQTPRFIQHSTPWESLTKSYEGGEKEEEFHFAAAILNASHESIDYGYNVAQLLDFCRKAEDSNSKSAFNKFIDSLVGLNERGGVDAKDIQTRSEADLVECYSKRGGRNRGRFAVMSVTSNESSQSDSSNSETNLDVDNLLGDASSYPSL